MLISDVHARMLSCFSYVQLFVTLWTIAQQDPLSKGFSRQEYWSGFPCPPPGDFPDPGIQPVSLASPALAGGFFITSTTWEAQFLMYIQVIQFYIYIYIYTHTHTHTHILFFNILFYCDLSQNVEHSSPCSIVGLCCLSIRYIIACNCFS